MGFSNLINYYYFLKLQGHRRMLRITNFIDETEVNNKEMFLRYPFSHLQ